MKNVLYKKNLNLGKVKIHVYPPPIPLTRINNNEKLYKDSVKTKLSKNLTSGKSDFYEFKMALFDNGKLKEFLLLISNFQMTLEAAGTISTGAKIHFLCTLVHGKALIQLGSFLLICKVPPQNI